MIFQILGLLFIGLVIGALARLIKPGRQKLSIWMTLVLGVVGALIGGFLASLLGTGNIFELDFLGFVFAVVAAVLLVGVAEGASARK
ncbi:GlsB/YeaQ/YmgE family stress response membrane protein [Nocardioides iriomotensis]|uniref:GlsB/YeaQ/YmgE family stress response membrane protein n=1 Tax=Nocardioides iriomotensis TaxID=715784 RepID=UPI001F0FC46D|nr:GlsB/YeaQ/YmgE family stress response membrane protein [Nocardioides iriomotensis]